jgi:hypothetical protein
MVHSRSGLAPYFFRDLADGIQQQMFFWGQDVLHPAGNLLVSQGFSRSPSTGIRGTSCYRREWQNGHLELYGSVAGWYGPKGGFSFVRPKRKCVVWLPSDETPVPGAWQVDSINRAASRAELYDASRPFLNWLIAYESEIFGKFGSCYRDGHYRKYGKVPKNRVWLPPARARQWFQMFLMAPEALVRPRQLMPEARGKDRFTNRGGSPETYPGSVP